MHVHALAVIFQRKRLSKPSAVLHNCGQITNISSTYSMCWQCFCGFVLKCHLFVTDKVNLTVL